MTRKIKRGTCPNCGKDMKYVWLNLHPVEGTGENGSIEVRCCCKWCADQIKKVIDRGNTFFKCPVCGDLAKRNNQYLTRVKVPTCSKECADNRRRRLWRTGAIEHVAPGSLKAFVKNMGDMGDMTNMGNVTEGSSSSSNTDDEPMKHGID